MIFNESYIITSDEKEALNIMNLKKDFTSHELRKSYLRLSLKYHPDKNPNGVEQFKYLQDAYLILKKYIKKRDNIKFYDCGETQKMNYKDIIAQYFDLILKKYDLNKSQVLELFNILTSKTKVFTIDFINKLNEDTCVELLELINKYQFIIGFNNDVVKTFKTQLQKKYKKKTVITLNPTLIDLLNDNVYIFNHNNKKHYIPLWHNEVHFDDLTVFIQPQLEENFEIDDNNILHVFLTRTKEEMFDKLISIELYPNKIITIQTEKLYCKSYQTHILKGYGISSINEKDIFNTTKRDDIIVHIYIKN